MGNKQNTKKSLKNYDIETGRKPESDIQHNKTLFLKLFRIRENQFGQ